MTALEHGDPYAPAHPLPEHYHVVVPYTVKGLCEQTQYAVMEWGGSYTFHALDKPDAAAYAQALTEWWALGIDLVVIGQDIVPAPGMIEALLTCGSQWCAHPYYTGRDCYTTGLGLCKISGRITRRHPHLAGKAMDELFAACAAPPRAHEISHALGVQLVRVGCWQHKHPGRPVHLIWPRPGSDE